MVPRRWRQLWWDFFGSSGVIRNSAVVWFLWFHFLKMVAQGSKKWMMVGKPLFFFSGDFVVLWPSFAFFLPNFTSLSWVVSQIIKFSMCFLTGKFQPDWIHRMFTQTEALVFPGGFFFHWNRDKSRVHPGLTCLFSRFGFRSKGEKSEATILC